MRSAIAVVITWALHFGVLYGATALACARNAESLAPWIVAGASVAALAVIAALAGPAAARAVRGAQFADVLTAGLGALAALGVLWEASSLAGVRGCG